MTDLKHYALIGLAAGATMVIASSLAPYESPTTGGNWATIALPLGICISGAAAGALIAIALKALWGMM